MQLKITPFRQSLNYGIAIIIIVYLVINSSRTVDLKVDILKGKLEIKTNGAYLNTDSIR
jgi:hypothetical protein